MEKFVSILRPLVCAAFCLFAAACTGMVSGDAGVGRGPQGGSGAEGGGTPLPDPTGTIDPVNGLTCNDPGSPALGAGMPLSRLSDVQYRNAVQDLLALDATEISIDLAANASLVHGFENFEAQGVSENLVSTLDGGAQKLAGLIKVESLAPCGGTDATARKKCGGTFLQNFGKKAFRRPLRSDELQRWQGFFDRSFDSFGYEFAIRMTVSAFLNAPQFVYRIEGGQGTETAQTGKLSQYELATRLALFLTDAPPDAELTIAADNGDLKDKAKVQAHVSRLMSSERARAVTKKFLGQWLALDEIEGIRRESKIVSVTDAYLQRLKQSTELFVQDVFHEKSTTGDMASLFGDAFVYADKEIAPVYDASSASSNLERIALDPEKRSGLLTQAGWLTQHAFAKGDSPIHRGKFIAERILCIPLVPPPRDLVAVFPEFDPNKPISTRQLTEQVHESSPACGGCHAQFDGYGFVMGAYDQVGRWRTHEQVGNTSFEIDTRITVADTLDMDGDYADAVDFSHKLARSEQAAQCVVTQWAMYAFGREVEDADACVMKPIADALAKGGKLGEVPAAIAQSEAFGSVIER